MAKSPLRLAEPTTKTEQSRHVEQKNSVLRSGEHLTLDDVERLRKAASSNR